MIGLKRLREERGIDQKVLAIDLNVSQPTISDWENGRKTPSVENLVRLADYFSVPLDYLLGRIDQKEIPAPTSDAMIGDQIRHYRKSQKVSQKDLASQLFVSQQAVGKWERNEATPNPEAIVKLAQIFGITTDELLGCSEQKETPVPTKRDGQDELEQRLMQYVREMTPDQKKLLLAQMQVLAEQNE